MCSLLCSVSAILALLPVPELASLPVGSLVRLGKRKAQTQDAARFTPKRADLFHGRR